MGGAVAAVSQQYREWKHGKTKNTALQVFGKFTGPSTAGESPPTLACCFARLFWLLHRMHLIV